MQKNGGGEQLKKKDKIILICMAVLVIAIAAMLSDAAIRHAGFRIIDFAIVFLLIVSAGKPRNIRGAIRQS